MTGEAHEKAIEAARARAGTNYGGARVCVAAYLSSMAEQGDWDATNSVRLCDRCEDECGVSAGGDAGDRACSACGNESAPHIYPAGLALPDEAEQGDPLVRVSEVVAHLRSLVDEEGLIDWDWFAGEVGARFVPKASS